MKKTSLLFATLLMASLVFSQNDKDKAIFKTYKNGFYQNVIQKDAQETGKHAQAKEKYLAVDLSGYYIPDKPSDYTSYWHNEPLSQGATGTCWCFAATSFVESEIFRLTKQKIKLSEMFFVYWDYVERAKHFVKTRGETYFEHGSEANAVKRMMEMHGAVPAQAFPGKVKGKFHHHGEMMKEMKAFLEHIKQKQVWNETMVTNTIKDIMEHYMGEIPKSFEVEGKAYTPKTYLTDYLKLKPRDHFSFMSEKAQPYNQKTELIEPDNWWHSKDYYNVSLKDYMQIIDESLEQGFTTCICGDVTEPGHDKYAEAAIIPSFDIPQEYINENSRQYRLSNKATTDDHCIHFVGYLDAKDGHKWYLAKDSGSGAFDGEHKGYRFYRDDYVKLKTMNIMVHKNAAKSILDKIIK